MTREAEAPARDQELERRELRIAGKIPALEAQAHLEPAHRRPGSRRRLDAGRRPRAVRPHRRHDAAISQAVDIRARPRLHEQAQEPREAVGRRGEGRGPLLGG